MKFKIKFGGTKQINYAQWREKSLRKRKSRTRGTTIRNSKFQDFVKGDLDQFLDELKKDLE